MVRQVIITIVPLPLYHIQKTAIISITKMLDETEASYNKNLQSIRAVKAKFPAPKK